jgi:hypothetical protein
MSLRSKPLSDLQPFYIFLLLMHALRRVGGLSAERPLDFLPVATLQTADAIFNRFTFSCS